MNVEFNFLNLYLIVDLNILLHNKNIQKEIWYFFVIYIDIIFFVMKISNVHTKF